MDTGPVLNRVLLFSDFNCPFCYALHERLHDLNLIDGCEWRGVQHAPYLPRPMKPWSGSLGAGLRHEVSMVQRLAPGLPITLPPGKPNTLPAILQAVAVLRQDLRAGMEFVRLTYRAFWCNGQDISDPMVLKDIAGGQIGADDDEPNHAIAQKWETAWHATGQNGVPILLAPDGDALVGCVPVEQVSQFFASMKRS